MARRPGKPNGAGRPEPPRQNLVRPRGSYWEDPVYKFVSREHRLATQSGKPEEALRFADLMDKLAKGILPDDEYFRLAEQRRVAEAVLKRQRQQQFKGKTFPTEEKPTVNVGDLKRRVFNIQTSPENMVKALEAMPKGDREKTIKGLTPFLRSKIAKYLASHGY